jgi:hypothetical protein
MNVTNPSTGPVVSNPYQSPTEAAELSPTRTGCLRYCLAGIAVLFGAFIALSGVRRFIFIGGFEVLGDLPLVELGSVALWAATHFLGIASAFVASAGLISRRTNLVLLGIASFLVVCAFAFAWPMDFLWFGQKTLT